VPCKRADAKFASIIHYYWPRYFCWVPDCSIAQTFTGTSELQICSVGTILGSRLRPFGIRSAKTFYDNPAQSVPMERQRLLVNCYYKMFRWNIWVQAYYFSILFVGKAF